MTDYKKGDALYIHGQLLRSLSSNTFHRLNEAQLSFTIKKYLILGILNSLGVEHLWIQLIFPDLIGIVITDVFTNQNNFFSEFS